MNRHGTDGHGTDGRITAVLLRYALCITYARVLVDNCRYLMRFLQRLAERSDVNKMSVSNLAIVIGPNLLWPQGDRTYAFTLSTFLTNNQLFLLLRPFNGLFSRTTWVGRCQRGNKTSLDLNEVRDDGVWGWQWHQLDHMQTICTSIQTDNHTNTSSLGFLQAGCSS